jgi:hypothetical protein
VKRVVALTGNSLLIQGLASRLKDYAHAFDVRIVDLAAVDSVKQVTAYQPDIIIFEEGDLKDTTHASLVDFLNSLPEVILLELRLDNPNVQWIQSIQFKASTTDDLVKIFKTNGSISDFVNISS